MVKRSYIPDEGDLVWLDFDPHAGREQGGRRPALVLSPIAYNRKTGLAVACPITTHPKGYPFEVPIPAGLAVKGVILADHIKNIDLAARRAEAFGKAPAETMADVRHRIAVLIGIG